jgi:hypothetical protein
MHAQLKATVKKAEAAKDAIAQQKLFFFFFDYYIRLPASYATCSESNRMVSYISRCLHG